MSAKKNIYDLLIIGGGINGCGIASDAALRGLSVCLVEQGDLASQTSSSSSKLIHGGLRYLEHFDFAMVKKALDERATLMKVAPHLVKPLQFFIPYHTQMRPKWLLRFGLFIYDHLSRKNTFPNSQTHYRTHESSTQFFNPLKECYQSGFTYFDAQTNDTRLTIANAQQAKNHGACILTYHRFISATPLSTFWQAAIEHNGESLQINAKTIINAAGPWVNHVNQQLGIHNSLPINWIKGSHLLVKKLYEGKHAYLLQHDDKRIIFVIPYFQYSMIGTTDIHLDNISEPLRINQSEINYLLDLAQHYFKKTISEQDIISTWSGIRPLIRSRHDNARKMSRDYLIKLNTNPLPILSVYGGKITTYRQLAKQALEKLRAFFPHMPTCTTDKISLPGGNIQSQQWQTFYQKKQKQYQWINQPLFHRYVITYGSLIDKLLLNCEIPGDLGEHFGDDLYEREITYLIQYEWVKSVEDILRRLSDLGLTARKKTIANLENYLNSGSFR